MSAAVTEFVVGISGGAAVFVADSNERIEIGPVDPTLGIPTVLVVQAERMAVGEGGELTFYLDVPAEDYQPFFVLAAGVWTNVQRRDVERAS